MRLPCYVHEPANKPLEQKTKKAMSRRPWLFETLVGYGRIPCPPMALNLLFQKEQGRPVPKAIKAPVRRLRLHFLLHQKFSLRIVRKTILPSMILSRRIMTLFSKLKGGS